MTTKPDMLKKTGKSLDSTQLFSQTTVDPDLIRALFIRYDPPYLEIAMGLNLSKGMMSAMNHLDFVDYHFRQYVIGRAKNLRRVNEEIAVYLERYGDFAAWSVAYLLHSFEEGILVRHELYELIPHYRQGKDKLYHRFAFDNIDLHNPGVQAPQ